MIYRLCENHQHHHNLSMKLNIKPFALIALLAPPVMADAGVFDAEVSEASSSVINSSVANHSVVKSSKAIASDVQIVNGALALNDKTISEEPSSTKKILFQLDNDLFAGSDRDYTNGVRFGVVQEIPENSIRSQRMARRLLENSKKLLNKLQLARLNTDGELRFARGIGISQLIYTPENPFALSSPDGERPYASWLGLEYSLHVKEQHYVNSLTLSLGTTGDSTFAQPTQNWVHRNISNSPIFQGWDSQVPSELTLNLHFDHKQSFNKLSKQLGGGLEIDGYYEGGAALGNFRSDAYLGSLARIGYRLPSSFTTPRVQLGSYGHQFFRGTDDQNNKLSTYAFLGVRGTAVLHDITLDGPVFRDFDTGVKSKSLVGELIFGVGFKYKTVDVIFSKTVRSEEFTGQTENLRFGSVMIRCPFTLF